MTKSVNRPRPLTVRQAAWLLAVPTDTVWRQIRIGAFPSERTRSGVVIPAATVTRLMGRVR